MSILLVPLILILCPIIVSVQLDTDKGPPGLTSLFKQLNETQRKEFESIKEDKRATKAQIQEKIEAFINTLPDKLKGPANEIKRKIERLRAEQTQTAIEAASGLSDEAKDAINEIQKIKKNMDITPTQEREQIHNIIHDVSDSAREELREVLQKLRRCLFDQYVSTLFD